MADQERRDNEPSSQQLALVSIASQGQAGKVKAIMDRIDSLAQLEPERIRNIADLLRASKTDGGCGIGCW